MRLLPAAGRIAGGSVRFAGRDLVSLPENEMRAVRGGDLSFNTGVLNGMFTVPGDGSVDYAGIADFVRRTDYAGWIVVEAEQDPVKAPPLATVTRARRFIAGLLEQGK